MAVEDVIDKLRPPAMPMDPAVEKKIKRGRSRLLEVRAKREEAIAFANGEHYVRVAEDGKGLKRQGIVSVLQGGTKPDHRVRRSHDLIGPIIKGKVSAASQRVPGYETQPSNTDPENYTAAKVSERIAYAGYEKWRIKDVIQRMIWHACVTEEGFAMPNWNGAIGPFVDVSKHPDDPEQADPENPEYLGMGEVDIWVGGGLEVIWEPGVDFDKSRWWGIEHVRPKDDVEYEPGYIGGKLTPDATTANSASTVPKRQEGDNLVMITEFLERPCGKHPRGRRMFFANGKQIFATEDYPLRDHEGEVVDEPCLHRLVYDVNPASDRDKGLVRSLIESMRTYDFAWNKMSEFAAVGLVPQILAPEGAIRGRRDDTPGAVVEYDPSNPGGFKPEWAENLGIPNELFSMQAQAKAEMGFIAHENEVPSGVESARAIASLLERDQIAWSDLIENLAQVHARIMRDCLTLVQLYYDDDRMLKFKGRTGWLPIENFKGADLRGQTDVRVSPGSLEPRTRQGVEKRILMIAERFPGYFPPEVLLSALEAGNAEGLLQAYEEDVARANFLIAQIRAGTIWDLPERPAWPGEAGPKLNVETGEPEIGPSGPVMETTVPGWMPRPFDNVAVHKSVFEVWMKGDEWNRSGEEIQKATISVYSALLDLETRNAERARQLQNEMAEEAGRRNAAKGEPVRSMPSAPGSEGSPPGGGAAPSAGE